VDAVAPDLFAERRAELDLKSGGKGRRGKKFWKK
jgi:hypothetical protein